MSTQKRRYWEARLGTDELRKLWMQDLEGLGFFVDSRASDSMNRTDEQGTHYFLGRRSVAIEQFNDAREHCAGLFTLALTDYFAPKAQEKKENEDA